ncbi:MAG: hypothetical protein JWN86_3598 [Planctomycetota bacterium]|nr:hypothetical protein [Planctomycetota bacterium]
MPLDSNGKPIAIGDVVALFFRVEQVSDHEVGCNLHLLAVDPLGTEEARPQFACNSRLVVLASELVAIKPFKQAAEPVVIDPTEPVAEVEAELVVEEAKAEPATVGG